MSSLPAEFGGCVRVNSLPVEFVGYVRVSSLPAEFGGGVAVLHVSHVDDEVGEGSDRVGVVAAVILEHRDELRGVLQA